MRVDEQVKETEVETDRVLRLVEDSLRGFTFRRLGNRQFEAVGAIYEKRGEPATRVFVTSKMREARRDEQAEYEKVRQLVAVVSPARVDVHLKGFILRKLPLIFPQYFNRGR